MPDIRDAIIIIAAFILGGTVGTCVTQKNLVSKDIIPVVDTTYRKIHVNDSLEIYIPYSTRNKF